MNTKEIIKKAIGVALIGVAVFELYHFLLGEEHASHTWWCHVPVIGSVFCSAPNVLMLIISLVLGAIGVFLLLA